MLKYQDAIAVHSCGTHHLLVCITRKFSIARAACVEVVQEIEPVVAGAADLKCEMLQHKTAQPFSAKVHA
jgi:hypothetical protein